MRPPRSFGFVAFEHAASADALKSLRTIDFFGKTVRAGAPRRAKRRAAADEANPAAPASSTSAKRAAAAAARA